MEPIIIPSLETEIEKLQKSVDDLVQKITEGTPFIGGYAGSDHKQSETKVFLIRSGSTENLRGVIFKAGFTGTLFLCEFVVFDNDQRLNDVKYEKWYQRKIDEKILTHIKDDVKRFIEQGQFSSWRGGL